MSQRKGKATALSAAAAPTPAPVAASASLPAAPNAVSPLPPGRPSSLQAAFVFATVLSVYVSTVYPSVTGGDSGELIVTTCTLGIAHPPGYPLYTMLGALWSAAMPLGHRAYRMNVLSCVLGAAAAAAIAATTTMLASRTPFFSAANGSSGSSNGGRAWSGATVAGVYAGLGFAFMPTVWLYSIQGEVFALNNALVALLLFLTVRYYAREETVDCADSAARHAKKGGEGLSADVSVAAKQTQQQAADPTATATLAQVATPPLPIAPPSRRLVPLALGGAFLCGVCLTNQHTTVFPVLVTSSFISWSLLARGQLGAARVLQLVMSVLAGMSPYLYLAIRSHWRVMDSWGDQRTLRGFLTHLLREEYGTFQLAASEISSDPGMVSRLQVYGANMRAEMQTLAPLLALLGLWACARSASRAVRRSSLVLALSCLLYVLVFHKLANLDLRPLFLGVQARFWQQSNVYVCVFSGVGMAYLAQCVAALFGRRQPSPPQQPHSGASASSASAPARRFPWSWPFLLTAACTVASLVTHLRTQYPLHDHSGTHAFWTAGAAALDAFPPHSIVLLNGDLNNNMLKYPQQCEGRRPDVSLLSLQLMSWDWFVPVQRANYPNVTFPGVRYHVNTPRSFNIKRFLDANVAPPGPAAGSKKKVRSPGGVFLCGPFKDGDHSNIRYRDATTGADSLFYEEHPFGLCSQLLPAGSAPPDLADFLRRGWKGLARIADLPAYAPERFGEETWERVLYKDNWARLLHLASYASFHSNRRPDDADLLRLARDLTAEVWAHQDLLRAQAMLGPYEYRSAGVIFGLWAKHLQSQSPRSKPDAPAQAAAASRRMYYSWLRYLELQPGDAEIGQFVRERVNPYTGAAIPLQDLRADPEFALYQHLVPVAAAPPAKAGSSASASAAGKKKVAANAGKAKAKSQPKKK